MMGAMKLQGPCQQALQVEARQRLGRLGQASKPSKGVVGWLTIGILLENGGEKIGCSPILRSILL